MDPQGFEIQSSCQAPDRIESLAQAKQGRQAVSGPELENPELRKGEPREPFPGLPPHLLELRVPLLQTPLGRAQQVGECPVSASADDPLAAPVERLPHDMESLFLGAARIQGYARRELFGRGTDAVRDPFGVFVQDHDEFFGLVSFHRRSLRNVCPARRGLTAQKS